MTKHKWKPRGWAVPWIHPTGLFIRDYLLKHKEAYPYEIWKALVEARKKVFQYRVEILDIPKAMKRLMRVPVCTYQSFRTNYIRNLRWLGLIEVVREERVNKRYSRRYYRIVPGMEDDERWIAPQAARYPITRLGARRYKRKK